MASNKEIIESLYGYFDAGDVPAVLALMSDDIEWTEADGFPLAGTFVGPQAVLDGVFMRLGEIGDHWGVVADQYVVEGDTVVTSGTTPGSTRPPASRPQRRWPTCGPSATGRSLRSSNMSTPSKCWNSAETHTRPNPSSLSGTDTRAKQELRQLISQVLTPSAPWLRSWGPGSIVDPGPRRRPVVSQQREAAVQSTR
jgi:hypothetical protein